MADDKKKREKILKDCIPEMIVEIVKSIDIIISDPCLVEIDYKSGEKYSLTNSVQKEINGKKYQVGYRVYFIIQEEV